jgi:hypothetical protein
MVERYRIGPEQFTSSRIDGLAVYDPDLGRKVEDLESFSEGDLVEYDEEAGVVVEKYTSDFDWPGGDGETTVEASSDEPYYIVARESGGAKPMPPSELSSKDGKLTDVDMDEADSASLARVYYRMGDPESLGEFRDCYDELANIPGVDDPHTGFDSLPDGWDRSSVLQAYASLGGSWSSCNREMSTKKGPRFAKRWCSALKDEVLKTEEWRGGF